MDFFVGLTVIIFFRIEYVLKKQSLYSVCVLNNKQLGVFENNRKKMIPYYIYTNIKGVNQV